MINDTKVIPARLIGEKEGTGGKVEVLLLKRKGNDVWETLVKTRKEDETRSKSQLRGRSSERGSSGGCRGRKPSDPF